MLGMGFADRELSGLYPGAPGLCAGAAGDETGGQFDHGRRFFVYIECGRRNVVVSFAGQSSDRAHHCHLGHPGTDLGRLAQFLVHLSVKKSPLFGGQIMKQCYSKAA